MSRPHQMVNTICKNATIVYGKQNLTDFFLCCVFFFSTEYNIIETHAESFRNVIYAHIHIHTKKREKKQLALMPLVYKFGVILNEIYLRVKEIT